MKAPKCVTLASKLPLSPHSLALFARRWRPTPHNAAVFRLHSLPLHRDRKQPICLSVPEESEQLAPELQSTAASLSTTNALRVSRARNSSFSKWAAVVGGKRSTEIAGMTRPFCCKHAPTSCAKVASLAVADRKSTSCLISRTRGITGAGGAACCAVPYFFASVAPTFAIRSSSLVNWVVRTSSL